MPTARCSPIIVEEMADWTALGGANFGCLGDRSHTYGFHRAAFEVPPSDYSRRHDPGLPHNMDWACAGDFAHNEHSDLRARHAAVLAGLMRGQHPMIDEFIGQPVPGQPVKYWARWHGITVLRNYTGAGHTTWSHISWRRSRANERAYLWREADVTEYHQQNTYAAMLIGGSSCGPADQVPAEHRGDADTHGNAVVSQLSYHTALLQQLADRPAAAVTLSAEDRAAIVADLKAELGELLGRTRLTVDAPPAG